MTASAAITLSLGGTLTATLFSLTDEDDLNLAPAQRTTTHTNSGFRESPDYESPGDADGNNRYHVTVITTDNEGASSSRPLVIEVTNVDEDGDGHAVDHPAGGRAAHHGHAHRPRHEGHARSSGSGNAPICRRQASSTSGAKRLTRTRPR